MRRMTLDEMPADLRQRLEPRVDRLGYLGEFFRCAALQPKVLCAFLDLTERLREVLPENLTEVIALHVATWTGNAYERNQHERLCLKLGFTPEWIREASSVGAAPREGTLPQELTDDERLVGELVDGIIAGLGKGVDARVGAAESTLGEEKLIAILFLVGRYLAHGIVVNALGFAPPVTSIFEGDSA